MMGIVFALSGTLGTDDGLAPAALRRLIEELSIEGLLASDGRAADECSSPNDVLSLLREDAMSVSVLAARYRMTAIELVPRHFRAFDDAAPTLSELRALGIPQAVLGDGLSGVDHAQAELAGFRDKVLPAEDFAGGDARSVSAFAATASALHLPADRIWFVGAEPRADVAPARAAGFQTVWLNRTGAAYPEGVAPADHIIRDLRALLELIAEPYMRSAFMLRHLMRTALQYRPGHFVPADPLHEE
jgi:FMN phosphatase YigB (HAD superfamily)